MCSSCLRYSAKMNLQDLSTSPTSQSPAITKAENYRMEMRCCHQKGDLVIYHPQIAAAERAKLSEFLFKIIRG